MSRKHSKFMGLIRSFVPKSLDRVISAATPFLGDVVVRGSEFLKKVAPSFGSIAEKIADKSLQFLEENDDRKEVRRQLGGLSHGEYPSPWATVPSDRVAYESVMGFGKNPSGKRGNGLMLLGTNQPVSAEYYDIRRPPIAKSRPSKYQLPEINGFNSWPQPDYNRPPKNASEVGGPFRKVGPGTNLPGATYDPEIAARKKAIKAALKKQALKKELAGLKKPKAKAKKKPLKIKKAKL